MFAIQKVKVTFCFAILIFEFYSVKRRFCCCDSGLLKNIPHEGFSDQDEGQIKLWV